MITAPEELTAIEDWQDLSKVLFNEGIDTDAMPREEQQEAIEVWTEDRTRYLVPKLADKELSDYEALEQLLGHFGRTRARTIPTFCPVCGDNELYETCPANTYYTVRGVSRGESTHTIADRQESKPPSIDSPDLFRCEQCDFETEHESELLRFALIGGEIEGKVTIDNGVRVALLAAVGASDPPRSTAKADFHHPDAPAGWVSVVANGGDCVELPIASSDGPLRKEVVMRRAAEEIRERLRELEAEPAAFAAAYDGRQIEIGSFTPIEDTLIHDEYLKKHTR